MIKEELERALKKGLEQAEMTLSEEEFSRSVDFMAYLLEENEKMNLTAITEPEEMVMLHMIDSWTLLPLLDEEREGKESFRALDLGSGAGFPAVPLKILRPSLDISLMDAQLKRVNFLKRTGEVLSLEPPYRVFQARAEEAGRRKEEREAYDFVTARAVAELRILLEYAMPLVKPGGIFCAMKAEVDKEVRDASRAIEKLGGELLSVERFTLPGTEVQRSFVRVRKKEPCRKKYPRPNAKIRKSPL